MFWYDKRFHSLNYFLKNKFDEKVIKISIDGGFTCPNRDGSLSSSGCIFCSGRGSGEFTYGNEPSIKDQFHKYRDSVKKKWPNAKYMPYFQAYTNTYDTVENLKRKYYEALELPDVVGISIATRPDCLPDEVLKLLENISKHTFLMTELGFQTSKESTAEFINRCYPNETYLKAVSDLKSIGSNVVTHTILGLPYEDSKDMHNTVDYVVNAGTDGIKLHLLYIMKNTILGEMYNKGTLKTFEFDEYIKLAVDLIEKIPENVVIHRLTGDAPREELLAPLYSLKKFHILNGIDDEFRKRDSWQGKFSQFRLK